MLKRGPLKQLAWRMALIAILLVTCMPTLSRVWNHLNREALVFAEICTVHGTATRPTVSHAPESPLQTSSSSDALDSCPFCVIHYASPIPQNLRIPPQVATGGLLVPRLFLSARHPLFAWSAAQPRAPPQA